MKVENIKINLEKGLYARLATIFCHNVSSYKSSIWLEKDGKKVNGKSLLGILSLGLNFGSNVKVIVDGVDEDKLLSEIIYTLTTSKNNIKPLTEFT